MSKKSRRRNKKILGLLGVLGAGLAMANRGKGTEMSNISVDSGRDGDSSSAKARAIANAATTENTIMDNMPKKKSIDKVIIPKKKPIVISPPIGRMRGAGTDAEAIDAQKTRGDYAQSMKDYQADETSVGNYPTETFLKPNIKGRFGNSRAFKSGGRAKLRSGGRVKGAGCAKRGFGKAFKGGKK